MKSFFNKTSLIILGIVTFSNCNNYDIEDVVPTLVQFTIEKKSSSEIKTNNSYSNAQLESKNEDGIIIIEESISEWDEATYLKTNWPTTGTSVNWSIGDQVGIFMRSASGGSNYFDVNNIRYSISNGGNSTSPISPSPNPIYFPHPHNNQNVIFYSYYPYTSGNNNISAINFTLPTNQTTAASLASADFMYAKSAAVNGNNPNVGLTYNHKMVLLSFQIRSLLPLLSIRKVSLSGSALRNSGTFNMLDDITVLGTTSFEPFVDTNVPAGQTVFIDIIINPCTVGNNVLGSELRLNLSLLGLNTSLRSAAIGVNKTFVPGYRYSYTVSTVL